MRRILQVLVLSMVIGGSVVGTAFAATSPAASTGAATNVGDSTATLNGVINPNGRTTQYDFSFGPTNAYGSTTVLHTVKAGTKPVAVSIRLIGLTPGTTYHYRINASSSGGSGIGADRHFTTTGHSPAAVVTGGPTSVGKTVATLTGVINPEGATTTWVIQYGLTAAYGMQSFPGTLAGVTTPVGVSGELTGLSPATLFHYRIVAYHGARLIAPEYLKRPAAPGSPPTAGGESPAADGVDP